MKLFGERLRIKDRMSKLIVKLGAATAVGLLGLQLVLPAFALELGAKANLAVETNEKAGSRPGLLRNVLDKRGKASVGSGILKSKSGDTAPATLVVTGKDGKDYSVSVDASTQLRRHFWGKATLSEMSVSDTLNVIGQWADDGHTAINATLIRDASVQKRLGVFMGTVQSLTGSGWTMQTGRGIETVTISSSTKLVNRKEQIITQTQVKVNDKVRVRGLWDNKLNTITEVSNVKDYNLPLAPTTTP